MSRCLSALLTLVLALGLSAAAAPDAEACSCVPPDVSSAYGWATDVAKVRVWGAVKGKNKTFYRARVLKTFKGCSKKHQFVWLSTSNSSAACGITLKMGGVYLINGMAETKKRWNVGLCGMNVPWKTLSSGDKDWLGHRYVCCGDKCSCVGGAPPVQCFVDPCEVTSCPEGTCEANYCGGCHAEFYDTMGKQVCTDCEGDEDCSWGQECTDHGCLSEGGPPPGTWYTTCGYPVCGPNDPPPGDLPKCPQGISQGDTCGELDYQCDAGLGCGASMLCAEEDPKSFGCPISRANKKSDIAYLDAPAQQAMAKDLLDFKLATYRYKAQGPQAPERLGFMIDDVEPSVAVDEKRDMVDLYGYLSMAVATLQVQSRQIEALRAEVDRLEAALEARIPAH